MSEFKYRYDEVGDVLYTYIDKPEEASSTADDSAGLLYRTSLSTGKPCGVTILDFKYTYGLLGGDVLCFNIQHFLKEIPLKEIEDVVYKLLEYKDNNGFHNKI
jgi:hypothetical protein